jgi:hypothetical protein
MFRILAVAAMAAVTAMHEDVHDRTQQQNEIGKRTKKMGTMLSEEEVQHTGDQRECGDPVGRAPEAGTRIFHTASVGWFDQSRTRLKETAGCGPEYTPPVTTAS